MSASEVRGIPLSICLAFGLSLLASWSVGEEVVNELNGKDFDLRNVFEGRNVYMLAFGDVQEDAIDEEKERFNVQELAPRQTQVEEELSEPFIVNALFVHLLHLLSFRDCFLVTSRSKPVLFVLIHELLVFFIEILIWRLFFLFLFLDFLEVPVRNVLVLSLFLLFTFHIDFPILLSRLTSRFFVKVQNQTFLYLNVQLDVLLFSQSAVVVLLHENEPLWEDALELY